jgi:UDP-glucuronate 4-epimerase
MRMTVLVTGAAGFIGYHACQALLDRGETVVGADNLNTYYDVRLKEARLSRLQERQGFSFHRADVSDRAAMRALFAAREGGFDRILHLAAQAGVRYSLEDPYAYIQANVMGTTTVFEEMRRSGHSCPVVYASSSSVYGGNDKLPFSVGDRVDRPVSLYAATKCATELVAHVYSHLYGIPATGLRFFTVYGPWGRPDMAAYLFADAIRQGRPIRVFNEGRMQRDFTYVDDVVAGILAALDRPPEPDEGGVRHRIYNLGNNKPESLLRFIELLERHLGIEAQKRFEPMQPGDVPATFADIEASRRDLGFEPRTPLETGLALFARWYSDYHGPKA